MKKLILILTFLVGQVSFANELTVLGEIFRPFSYIEDGKKKGMVYEMVSKILAGTDIKVSKSVMSPWKSVFEYAKNNSNTLLYTIVKSDEREKFFHWIGPISPRKMYLYKLAKRKDIKIYSWSDAKKYITLSLDKGIATDLLESKKLKILKTKDLKQAYEMLVKGRGDLAAIPDYSFVHLNKGRIKAEKAWRVDQPGEYYIALNINTSPVIVKKIRDSFEKLRDDGEIARIRAKYLSSN